jgi:hypothetical protein
MLNGVSVAHLTVANPPAVITSRNFASPRLSALVAKIKVARSRPAVYSAILDRPTRDGPRLARPKPPLGRHPEIPSAFAHYSLDARVRIEQNRTGLVSAISLVAAWEKSKATNPPGWCPDLEAMPPVERDIQRVR